MLLVVWVLSVILLCMGIRMVRKVAAKEREFRKFEFENRSSGGVLQFPSFEASEAYKAEKRRAGNYFALALMLVGFGGLGTLGFGFSLI